MNLDVIVVASHHKKALVLDHLQDVPHKVNYTPDYDLPPDFQSEVIGLVRNHVGALRCLRGHQDAIKLCDTENVLILEDDAVPNTNEWQDIVSDSIHLLDNFEVVSLHGRNFDRSSFENYEEIRPGNSFLHVPNKIQNIQVCGSLAYLLNRRSFDKMQSIIYNGMPMDLLLVNHFSFCLIEKSPFNHDRSEGSLIDVGI